MARFNIFDRQTFVRVTKAEVEALGRACAIPGWRGAEVNVVITDDAGIAPLNRRFTGRPGATDVLAFALEEAPPPGARRTIGDVIINGEHARAEAEARGVSPRDELALYVVHGLLHLAGYDDHGPGNREEMYAREAEILRQAGWVCVR